MGKSNIMICLEKKEEHQKVENLIREVFGMYIVQDALSIMYCISSEMIRHLFQNWIRAMVSAAMKQIRIFWTII